VASPAGSSPPVLVDVEEMKIPISIAKLRERPRSLDRHCEILVAREAERVLVDIETGVEFRWKRFLEQAEVRTSVGLVALRAAVLADRLVPLLVLIQQLLHVDQRRVAGFDRLVVAAQAELSLGLQEIRIDIRRVRRMTIEATGLVDCRRVIHHGFLRFTHDVVVALVAKLLPLRGQHVLAWTTVRVVTLGATILNRAVNRIGCLDELSDLIVTIPAEFYALGAQQ